MAEVSRAEMVREFAGYTSAHGPSSIVRAHTCFWKLIWTLCLLAAWSVMGYQVHKGIKAYAAFPVNVNLRVSHKNQLEFPAITICNLNSIRLSHVRDLPEFHVQLDLLEELNSTQYGNWDTEMTGGDMTKITQETLLANGLTNCIYEYEVNVSEFGHQLEDMMVECTFQGRQCYPANFTKWQEPHYGNCYTIFVPQDENLFASGTGPMFGLSLSLFIQDDEYMPVVSPAGGFRVEIHPTQYPSLPEAKGFTISPGFQTSIAMTQRHQKRLPLPYDGTSCGPTEFALNEKPNDLRFPHKFSQHMMNWAKIRGDPTNDKKSSNYTNIGCIEGCKLAKMAQRLGCFLATDATRDVLNYTYGIDPDIPACDTSDEEIVTQIILVMSESTSSHEDSCESQCFQACDERSFQLRITSSLWPRTSYYEQFKYTWMMRVPNATFNGSDSARQSMAKLEVYYQDLNCELITEEVAIDVWALLSTVGGTLGLYAGLSFLTIGEIFELIWMLMFKRSEQHEKTGSQSAVKPLDETDRGKSARSYHPESENTAVSR